MQRICKGDWRRIQNYFDNIKVNTARLSIHTGCNANVQLRSKRLSAGCFRSEEKLTGTFSGPRVDPDPPRVASVTWCDFMGLEQNAILLSQNP